MQARPKDLKITQYEKFTVVISNQLMPRTNTSGVSHLFSCVLPHSYNSVPCFTVSIFSFFKVYQILHIGSAKEVCINLC